MIEGLQAGNAALVGAAAEQMHANSADVGGNNIPMNGGTYNADGLTVAEVLSTAGCPGCGGCCSTGAAAPTLLPVPTAGTGRRRLLPTPVRMMSPHGRGDPP